MENLPCVSCTVALPDHPRLHTCRDLWIADRNGLRIEELAEDHGGSPAAERLMEAMVEHGLVVMVPGYYEWAYVAAEDSACYLAAGVVDDTIMPWADHTGLVSKRHCRSLLKRTMGIVACNPGAQATGQSLHLVNGRIGHIPAYMVQACERGCWWSS